MACGPRIALRLHCVKSTDGIDTLNPTTHGVDGEAYSSQDQSATYITTIIPPSRPTAFSCLPSSLRPSKIGARESQMGVLPMISR